MPFQKVKNVNIQIRSIICISGVCDMRNGSKNLVILACSQKKAESTQKAQDLYQGSLFKLGRRYAEINHFDFVILSAKYGLIHPDDKIAPYNQRLNNKKDVKKLQEKVLPQLKPMIDSYDRIITVGGKFYREVIEPLDCDKFENIVDNRGIGGMLQKLKILIENS